MMYDPITKTRVRVYWAPYASDTTDIRQNVAVEMTGISLHIPQQVMSIFESEDTLTVVLKKGDFVVSEPKPAPPKPTVNDFVPDYKVVMSKFANGDPGAFTAYLELYGKIVAAGFTMTQVAQAAGPIGGK